MQEGYYNYFMKNIVFALVFLVLFFLRSFLTGTKYTQKTTICFTVWFWTLNFMTFWHIFQDFFRFWNRFLGQGVFEKYTVLPRKVCFDKRAKIPYRKYTLKRVKSKTILPRNLNAPIFRKWKPTGINDLWKTWCIIPRGFWYGCFYEKNRKNAFFWNNWIRFLGQWIF